MALNGWQRLWVVLTFLWTSAVTFGTWQVWPTNPNEYISIFPGWGDDGQVIGYYDAWAKLYGGTTSSDTPSAPEGRVVMMPKIGKVRFPSAMNEDELKTAAKSLHDENETLLQDLNRKAVQAFRARRVEVIRGAAAFWLLPPAVLYALGLSVGWVYRGSRDRSPNL